MKVLEFDRATQDIILACKGRYRENAEQSSLDVLKRVCGHITGLGAEHMDYSGVMHWMYQTWEELNKHPETMMPKQELKEYIMGCNFYQRNPEIFPDSPRAFLFLYSQIQMCRAYEKDEYNLVLELNPELDTEWAKADRERIEESNRKFMEQCGITDEQR